MKLSIVLPGYNERASLVSAIEAYRQALDEIGQHDYELLIVDDGSTDDTGAVARSLADADPRVRLLSHPVNRGQVESILTGFGEARGEIVTHNGMDLPFDPRDMAEPLRRFSHGADVVVVEREHRGSYGWARRLLSWANVAIVRALFRSPARDHNFVQFFRRDVVSRLPVRSRGVSTVTTELILRAFRRGYQVHRVTAPYHARRAGRSTITARKAARALMETLRLRWRLAND